MEELQGLIEQVVYRNDDTGYTVLEVRVGRESVPVVGVLPFLHEGEQVLFEGEWTEHPDYGRQLKASRFESVLPSDLAGIERFLGSGLIKGCGPATARAIVRALGKDTLQVLDTQPHRIASIPGIGRKRAASICESYQQHRGMQRTMVFLQNYGVTPAQATRIYQAFGERSEEIVRENPYRLCAEVQGIGFRTADRIAAAMGVAPDAPFRLSAGLLFCLEEAAAGNGHVYLPREELIAAAGELLEAPREALREALTALVIGQQVVLREIAGEQAAYLEHYYRAEGEVARRLHALTLLPARPIDAAEEALCDYESSSGMRLAQQQQQAVLLALKRGAAVITGGPGTGKTTIINCLLEILDKAGCKSLLCAPTGRAAKRMSEATGHEAKTIHRLLEYGGGEERAFGRDEEHPLECDAVIVDEMSMVDLLLMRALLRALPQGTRLVLVGDADQLPSVGAGSVLRNVIDSRCVPTVRLTEIFRQAAMSMIVTNAHRIHRGETPEYNRKGSDFFLERQPLASAAVEAVVDLCVKRLPNFLGVGPGDIQVMTPMKKGDLGTAALNLRLQAALNPPRPGKPEWTLGERVFRLHDRVMQVRNNYQAEWVIGEGTAHEERGLGVFNGDIGRVTALDKEARTLCVTYDDERQVTYDSGMLEELEMAYAITIHKSQGSEFPCVVIPVVGGPPMLLTRNLLYTAVTRARRLCVLVGREDTIGAMIARDGEDKRYSALAERLQALSDFAQEAAL